MFEESVRIMIALKKNFMKRECIRRLAVGRYLGRGGYECARIMGFIMKSFGRSQGAREGQVSRVRIKKTSECEVRVVCAWVEL